jgi:hypothetical protein
MSPTVDVALTVGSFLLIFCLALAIRIGFRRGGGGR